MYFISLFIHLFLYLFLYFFINLFIYCSKSVQVRGELQSCT